MSKKTRVSGEKFPEKYGTETATIYKGDTEALQIPPLGHPLYDPTAPTTFDPIIVEAIDRDGKMTTPIEVFTDPDAGTLWVTDGRGRLLCVREVNRRRKKEGRELVKPYIVPFSGTEDEAVLRVREKNYHRRTPSPSARATDLHILRRRGFAWDKCAKALHVVTEDPEQWGRKLLPLAFCIPEVQALIDAGDLPQSAAVRFGGSAPDGSKTPGRKDQLALLAEMQGRRASRPSPAKAAVPWKGRQRVAEALSNGASEALSAADRKIASVVAATIARLSGDPKALRDWPEVSAIVEEALKPLPKGPKKEAKGG